LVLNERPHLKLKSDFVEDIWIEICCIKFQLVVGTVCFHLNNSHLFFTEAFQSTPEKLTARRLPYFILGDFHINVLCKVITPNPSIPAARYLHKSYP